MKKLYLKVREHSQNSNGAVPRPLKPQWKPQLHGLRGVFPRGPCSWPVGADTLSRRILM